MNMTDTTATDNQLRLLVERAERVISEKEAVAADLKDVFAEAKATGYCPKTMRQIIKLRAMERQQRLEAEAMLDTYKSALGID